LLVGQIFIWVLNVHISGLFIVLSTGMNMIHNLEVVPPSQRGKFYFDTIIHYLRSFIVKISGFNNKWERKTVEWWKWL